MGDFAGRVQHAGDTVGEQIGSYDFEGGLDLADAIGALPDFMGNVRDALHAMSQRVGDGPFSQAAKDLIEELSSSVGGLVDEATQAHTQFEHDHEPELRRLREPRPNEHQWDSSTPGNQA